MFVAEISWQIPSTSTAEQLDEISYGLLAVLHKNGQVISWDYPIAIDGKLLRTFVTILEPDSLQMHGTAERFGIRQMSDLRSRLAKQGREICDKLTNLTGKPVYYYLYRYQVKTNIIKEKQRRCPSCDGEWLLEQKLHLFDFKCDACRLVSNISFTVN